MGKLFNDRTEILYQKPSHPREYFRSSYLSKWILLPMCAYKVSVPYPRENSLNLFQETILKLFVSGAKENEWLANVLSLNVSLIEFIVDELKNKGLINSRRSLTNIGHALLNNNDDTYEMKTGYVFYNYVTKTFMDTFVPDNEFYVAGIRNRRGNRIQFFVDESVANPEYKTATIVHAENEENEISPTVYDILKICKKHRRRVQQLVPNEFDRQEEDTEQGRAELPQNIEKVTLLGEKRYVYVSTYLILPTDDLMNRSRLQMCYPFGSGFSTNILESVLMLCKNSSNEDLRETINGLKNDVYGMTEQQLDRTKQAQAEVNKSIKRILSNNIEKYTYVHQMLLSVESDYVQIQALLKQNTGSNWDYIQKKINDYIVDNYNLIAGILIELIQKYDYYKQEMLTKYPIQNSEILSSLATQVGFKDTENVFGRFFSLKKGTVNTAYSSSKVDALIAYNLIVAAGFHEHPLYKLAKEVPQFITYLNKLIDLRNDGMHGNSIEYNFNTIAAYSIKNMYIAYLLLEDLTFVNDRKFDFESERLVDKDRLKVTKNAEMQVEKIYTDNSKKYSVVINKLVALQEEVILRGEDYPGRVSEVLEAIFKKLCSQRLVNEAIVSLKDYKDQDANHSYLNMMRKDGFILQEIPFYNLRKLTQTFSNYHNATLGTLFYAWYFSEKKKQDSIIPEVAEKVPELVKVISEINTVRGHNGKMDFNNNRLEYLKSNIDTVINGLMDIMAERGIY